MLALVAIALVVVQQVPGLVFQGGVAVPLLPVGLWRAWIPLVLTGLVVLAVSAAAGLQRPGPLSTAGRLAGLLLALGPLTVLAFRGRLVDPLFVFELGLDPSVRAWPAIDVVLGTLLAVALAVTLLSAVGAGSRPRGRARGRAPR